MASTNAPSLTQPVWNTDPISLKDFCSKNEVPSVARVVKGHFMTIGAPTLNPLKKVHRYILIHSVKTGLKIFGHSVMRIKSRDGRTTRLTPLDQKLSIPLTYKGWFELLSENGRSVRPIESVSELAKLYPSMNRVLVRQNVQVYIVDEAERKLVLDKTKIVIAGDQLTLSGEPPIQIHGKLRLLKCTDSSGETIYLSLDQRGCFTPIASDADVIGVFRISDVVHRFRLPLTVKLVHGVWPKVDTNRFTGLIRLDWAYTDETAFVCPLDKNTPRICPIPTEAKLRLVNATNNKELQDNGSFTNIMTKCNRLVSNYHNTIHMIITVPEGALKAKSNTLAKIPSDMNSQTGENDKPSSQMKHAKSKEEILMAELDDLYGYLRQGKQPPVGKYTRESDEETYYEELECEPMTEFKPRLDILNPNDGASRTYNVPYNFVDRWKNLDAKHNRFSISSVSTALPELPPRTYRRSASSPQIFSTVLSPTVRPISSGTAFTVTECVQTPSGSASSGVICVSNSHLPLGSRCQFISTENVYRNSKNSSSNGSSERKETDYKKNRHSKNESSDKIRRRMSIPFLYL